MTDYNELKKLAEAANIIAKYGWYQKYEAVDGIGDDADAEFVAACPPQAVLDLLDHIAQLEASVKSLHIKLAGETLRADQGWERYEYANKSNMVAIAKSASKEK